MTYNSPTNSNALIFEHVQYFSNFRLKPSYMTSKAARKYEPIHSPPSTNLPSATMSNTKHSTQASKGTSSSKKPKRKHYSLTLEGKARFIASVQAAK
ncbi:hypothetical protein BGZ51_007421 [Haplosporangium sp. Z 767]|nr:hypothetical protein BGZ51_007421 [Haplosporangium sp. Z 767]KAF9196861.1 hypothetical protein BGZ50_005935 [Haplosporangium sp. Z 11]